MWTHPSPLKRYAASLAFNHFYTIFREEESLVDQYILEITVHAMQGLAIASVHSANDEVTNVNPVEETKESLEHVTRILSQKTHLWKLENLMNFSRNMFYNSCQKLLEESLLS